MKVYVLVYVDGGVASEIKVLHKMRHAQALANAWAMAQGFTSYDTWLEKDRTGNSDEELRFFGEEVIEPPKRSDIVSLLRSVLSSIDDLQEGVGDDAVGTEVAPPAYIKSELRDMKAEATLACELLDMVVVQEHDR